MKFGFIGCGNMGGALLAAVVKTVGGNHVYASDPNEEKLAQCKLFYHCHVGDTESLVENCDYLFLGVKPQIYPALFEELAPLLALRSKTPPTLISMAAGISVSAVEQLARCDTPIIRIMPNTPVLVEEGMILYTYNNRVTKKILEGFLSAMIKAGTLDEIAEDKIDAASALSGCGPAFVYMFAEALADGAIQCGLPREKALLYAAQTLHGASKLMMESDKTPGELRDAVCSPGGTTIEGVRALEGNGFHESAMQAITAAYKRTLELKK